MKFDVRKFVAENGLWDSLKEKVAKQIRPRGMRHHAPDITELVDAGGKIGLILEYVTAATNLVHQRKTAGAFFRTLDRISYGELLGGRLAYAILDQFIDGRVIMTRKDAEDVLSECALVMKIKLWSEYYRLYGCAPEDDTR